MTVKEPLTLHVSPTGEDRWSGTVAMPAGDGSDGPLATLSAARDAVRRCRGQHDGPVTVQVGAGVYERTAVRHGLEGRTVPTLPTSRSGRGIIGRM